MAIETWPHIDDQSRSLAEALRSSIVEFELREGSSAFGDVQRAEAYVTLYAKLSEALDERGGYFNWVLADMTNRLVVARLSHVLVTYPNKHPMVRALLSRLSFPYFREDSFVRLLEEQGVADAGRQLAEKRGVERLEKSLQLLGISGPDAFSGSEIRRYTSNLLERKDVFTLLMRLLETDLLVGVNLRGSLEYVGAGGDFLAIRLDDVRAFNQVLGEARDGFKNDYFHVKRLYASHVAALKEEFSRPVDESGFYRIAIN
jgi:hypothetical protein